MRYPTLAEVEAADHEQICRWHRFLQSPGWRFIGTSAFQEKLEHEGRIMDRIEERFAEFGGFTPALSKKIGWDE